jgi:hypothetical protein
MLFQPKAVNRLESLGSQIERAHAITPQLIEAMLSATGAPDRADPGVLRRIEQLIEVEAWTDATLLLIDIARPWRLRHIACDAGAWYCSLSRHPQLPDWLDQTVDGRHGALPLAILCALVEACRTSLDDHPLEPPQPIGTITEQGVCCDNFS